MDDYQIFYWWRSGTLVNCVRTNGDGSDPSITYTSTDLSDALEQAGYDPFNGLHLTRPNEAPDLEADVC